MLSLSRYANSCRQSFVGGRRFFSTELTNWLAVWWCFFFLVVIISDANRQKVSVLLQLFYQLTAKRSV